MKRKHFIAHGVAYGTGLGVLALGGCTQPSTDQSYGASDIFFIPGNYVAAYDNRLPGRIDEVIGALLEAGFAGEEVDRFVCLANGESGMGEATFNGSCCHGLLQVHSVHRGKTCPTWNTRARTDPESIYNFTFNAKCAYKIYKSQGIKAWESWGRHCKSGAAVVSLGARRQGTARPPVSPPKATPSCGPVVARVRGVQSPGRVAFEVEAPGAQRLGVWDGRVAFGGPVPPVGGVAQVPTKEPSSCTTYTFFAFKGQSLDRASLCGRTQVRWGPGCGS